MNKEQKMVWDFHNAMGRQDMNALIPYIPKDKKIKKLRLELIKEETRELKDALERKDMVAVADALGDLLYVVYGAANQFGIDLEPIFEEIQKSNMTKSGADPREDGKIMKGPNYIPPDLKPIIENQVKNPRECYITLTERKIK